MKREAIPVAYSHEHGDENLPFLKDLVSVTEDLEKPLIMSYLKTHCVMACPGIIYDEITPGKIIGAGNVFSDGKYFWNDVFTNYVERYNIPVPDVFRRHILSNHSHRSKRHTLLRLVDRLEIENNPYLGYKYHVVIHRNGLIEYWNNTDHKDKTVAIIKRDDAAYIIDPITTELFCYDSDNHGETIIDGYHWKLTFFKHDICIETVEGRSNEDPWRYGELKDVIEFAERYVPFDLGSRYMK